MATGENGTAILLKIGTKIVSGITSNTFDESIDTIETTHKLSTDRAKTYIGGEYGATISVDAIVDPADVSNATYSEVRTAMLSRELIAFAFGGVEVGDKYLTGDAIINSLGKSAAQNGKVTFSVGLQVSGLPTEATVTT